MFFVILDNSKTDPLALHRFRAVTVLVLAVGFKTYTQILKTYKHTYTVILHFTMIRHFVIFETAQHSIRPRSPQSSETCAMYVRLQ
jgi:predicted dinucleotide-binding enzyme